MLPEIIMLEQFSHFLKPRPRAAHKGDAGHVLVIGGDEGHTGAPRMAAAAALRVGAGLVSIATHAKHAAMFNLLQPEIMCHAVKTAADLKPLLQTATVVVIGPGMGQASYAKQFLKAVMATELPLVMDADALNLLAQKPSQRANWILTPHPGEAARLLQSDTPAVQQDRLAAVQQLQNTFGGVAVLKGAGTLVQASNGKPAICEAGNPGMASGGMGDVLSGVIGGILAQGVPLADAAKLSVCLHAQAGDMAAHHGGERGLIATDLMYYLRLLVNPDIPADE